MLTPATPSAPSVWPCTLRRNTSAASLACDAPVCTVHNRTTLYQRGEKEMERSLFWTVEYLPACLLKKMSNRGQTAPLGRTFALYIPHIPYTLALRFSPRNHLFLPRLSADFFFHRERRMLKNKDRYKYANTAIITLPTLCLSATTITQSRCDRSVIYYVVI